MAAKPQTVLDRVALELRQEAARLKAAADAIDPPKRKPGTRGPAPKPPKGKR
jgi:hypothetical protein